MRGLVWVLALFALAVAVSLGLQVNDGYVLLVLPPWRAEVSLNLALIVLLLLFLFGHGVLRALALTRSLPERVRAHRERHRQQRAAATFYEAVRLLFEGRYGHALKKAADAHAAGQAPGLSALIAARAAQRLREPAKQQAWLDRAVQDDDRTLAARLMLEAEMLIDARRFAEAAAILTRLHGVSGRHIAALRLELRARQGCGEWDEVLRLARQLEKRAALLPEAVREIKLTAHEARLRREAGDAGRLLAALGGIPEAEFAPRLIRVAAEALLALGEGERAARLIAEQLRREWSSELVRLYGLAPGEGDLVDRIRQAEAWLPEHPDDPQVLIALGRLCFRQRLWGKAQTYLEASLSVGESRDAHLELARLADELGRTEEADRHYRAAARPELCRVSGD